MTTIAPTSLRSRQTAELMVVSALLELMPLETPSLSKGNLPGRGR